MCLKFLLKILNKLLLLLLYYTVWGSILSTRNSLLWPISKSRASYQRTLLDDVKAHSAAELIAGIIAIQQDKGPDFGAKLNMNKHRILLESCQDDDRAVNLQRYFHDTFRIPLARIHIHPDNISDSSEKATARLHYGDIILGILASPFAEFIDTFVANAVEEISAEWRLASHRLKEEHHHLWYLLKHILASKFTNLFRGIPPRFAQPLADCLTQLHRETCEILAQCETIPDISFDLARIREGAGLGYADDLLESAFTSSKIASLRSIQ